MITIHELSVFFGSRTLFDKISFMVLPKDRIGLVGKNGAGKSTLLKTVLGEYTPDHGAIHQPKNLKVGYLPQTMQHCEENTILEEAQNALGDIKVLNVAIENITKELSDRTDYESDYYMDLIDSLNEKNDQLGILGGFSAEEQIEKILFGLGFESKDLNRKMGEFSGGWKMRVELAKLLLQSPDLLLLDEPTNHLDIESIQWLEDFLKNYNGSIILISHDRTFLDAITIRTIDIVNSKIYDYKFSYSKYIIVREEEMGRQVDAQKQQQKEIKQTEELINKFRAKKNKAAFAQSLMKKLDKMDRIEVDSKENSRLRFRFPPATSSGKVMLEVKELSKNFGNLSVFENMELVIGRGEKIALIGKNGVGKTTLAKMINEQEDYTGTLKLGHNVTIGYFAQNQADQLDASKTVFETIDDIAVGDIRSQIRSILGGFLFSGEDADKKVQILSGGERTRLALCQLLLTPVNFLILDEPTNHLDIASKEILKQALLAYDGTVLVISHDRDFLDGLSNRIYEVQSKKISVHHEGIFEFLAKKKAEGIAQYEHKAKQKQQVDSSPSDNKLSYEERKQLDRDKRKLSNQLSKSEKKIAELEEQVELIDKELASWDYNDEAATTKKMDHYNAVKKELKIQYATWESCSEKLDAFN